MVAQTFSVWEVILWHIIDVVPMVVFAAVEFRDMFRFSKKTSIVAIIAVAAAQVALNSTVVLLGNRSYLSVLDMLSMVVYFLFFFLIFNERPSRILFVMFILANFGNLVNTSAKCIEGLLMPACALMRYHYTYSIFTLIMELIIYPIPFLLIFHHFSAEIRTKEESVAKLWRMLWMVPASFFFLWMVLLYFSGETSLERMMQPFYSIYLGIIDAASFFIYWITLSFVQESARERQLAQENHMLSMQTLQFKNIQMQMDSTRTARHDLRHHIGLLQTAADSNDMGAIRDYLKEFYGELDLDSSILYCRNMTANTILSYYASAAKQHSINYRVNADIPEGIGITPTDLSVLLGNLLENAYQACLTSESHEREIQVRAECSDDHRFVLAIDNTSGVVPVVDKNGRFCSTKHSGSGIGIESVRSIAEKYHGMARFSPGDGTFSASVMLQPEHAQ
jgi:Histidine kinase-, DNA gyrase B-, and HSP90-like ATPase.